MCGKNTEKIQVMKKELIYFTSLVTYTLIIISVTLFLADLKEFTKIPNVK